eukprot:CAMPEP_0113959736 /NCGR_PEP_ID=MMETSP0011_2-20120614/4316_1 /TAXON_ID=101924 /ORGANISM="Rhodosorus marinus" /LENGTH=321 /DNA_ID=CAMNT_0000971093 /DNA_START=689 /DNA_END=1654 /DNA_ORIENTATION=+ /assembly_acc=CAM_ASM_000156
MNVSESDQDGQSRETVNDHGRVKRSKPRLTVNEEVMEKLYQKAKEVDLQPSRLANFVIDTYLAEIERTFFGTRGASTTVNLDQSSRNIDAVIVDDHAIYNCHRMVRFSIMEVLCEYHDLNLAFSELEKASLGNVEAAVRGIIKKHNLESKLESGDVLKQAYDIYLSKYATSGRLFAYRGVKDVISRLSNLGVDVLIATETPTPVFETASDVLELAKTVSYDKVVFVNQESAEESGGVLLQFCENLKLDSSRCVVLAATKNAVDMARSAEMRCIGVSLYEEPEVLSEAGAEIVRAETGLVTLDDFFGHTLVEEDDDIYSESS